MEKEELAKKYGIDLKSLEEEQLRFAKNIKIKDHFDLSAIERIGAIENIMVRNQILSAMIVCNKNFEIIEQGYFLDKLRFPYIYGFNAYRELPSMIMVFNRMREKPDVVLIKGEGINHSRLGIASHFSVSTGVPTISINDKLFEGNKTEREEVLMDDKAVGKVLVSKENSRPLYICPGDLISIKSSFDLIKKMIVPPHKMPEPMHLAHKYAKEIQEELKII